MAVRTSKTASGFHCVLLEAGTYCLSWKIDSATQIPNFYYRRSTQRNAIRFCVRHKLRFPGGEVWDARSADCHYRHRLIGVLVETVPMGSWPGGLCRVIKRLPDTAAPEIVFQVRHLDGRVRPREIGVFDYEQVIVYSKVRV